MDTDCKPDSLVSYYQRHSFNPVPIPVEHPEVWLSHLHKRRNLYERHLGIFFSLLRDRAVVEFGPNSGENALILAAAGAELTLVEPNHLVIPRLRSLFDAFGLSERIREIRQEGVFEFATDRRFDLVIAEGFLYVLPDKEAAIPKLASLLDPGGVAVVSYNDSHGILVECLKRFLLWRACRLSGEDPHGQGSLEIARSFFGEAFAAINSSRPFEAWWRDTLVNPFLAPEYLWSFPELLGLFEAQGCQFHSSSPLWSLGKNYRWYKDAPSHEQWSRLALEDWRRSFSFLITGWRPRLLDPPPVGDEVLRDVSGLVRAMAAYASDQGTDADLAGLRWPRSLDDCLREADPSLREFCDQAGGILAAALTLSADGLLAAYRRCPRLASAWGTPYHYLSCVKPPELFVASPPEKAGCQGPARP